MKWILVLILLCIPVLVLADETLIDETLKSGEKFNISGKEYTFVLTDPAIGYFTSPEGGHFIYNDTCDDKEGFLWCLSKTEVESYNYTIETEVLQGKVEVTKRTAEIDVSRNFSKTSLAPSESIDVRVVLTNTKDIKASEVAYRDPLEGFSILYVNKPCFREGTGVVWRGFINGFSEIRCRYGIKPLREGETSTAATLTYYDSLEEKTEDIEETVKVINDFVETEFTLNTTEVSLYNHILVEINLTSKQSKDMRGSSILQLPEGFSWVKKSSGIASKGDSLEWSGIIENDEKVSYYAVFETGWVGDTKISLENTFTLDNVRNTGEHERNITVSYDPLEFSSNLEQQYAPGNFSLFINVKNPSKTFMYTNIDVEVDAEIVKAKRTASELKQGNFLELIDEQFVIYDEKEYTLPLKVSYTLPTGQRVSENTELQFIVGNSTEESQEKNTKR